MPLNKESKPFLLLSSQCFSQRLEIQITSLYLLTDLEKDSYHRKFQISLYHEHIQPLKILKGLKTPNIKVRSQLINEIANILRISEKFRYNSGPNMGTLLYHNALTR